MRKETALRYVLPGWFVLATILAFCVRPSHCAERAYPAPKVVQEHIQSMAHLATRREKNPYRWLMKRREQIISQLIAGLDSCDDYVALRCLRILEQAEPRPEIRDALLRVAQNQEHPINDWGIASLRRYADNEKVRNLLESAYTWEERLSPYHRAMVGLGLDRRKEAGKLLLEALKGNQGGASTGTIIKRLGEVGATTRVPGFKTALEKELNEHPDSRRIYVIARLALARVAPDDHSLTEDQRTFLKGLSRIERKQEGAWEELAQLNREEIRPLVMRILTTRAPDPALAILRSWEDTAALQEIRRLIRSRSRPQRYVSAYLDISHPADAIDQLAELVSERESSYQIRVLRAGLKSQISSERKLNLVRVIREQLAPDPGKSVARVLSHAGSDIPHLLLPLMAEETELKSLSFYSKFAPQYPSEEVEAQLRRALHMAVAVGGSARELPSATSFAVVRIIKAAAAYELPDAGQLADQLLAFIDDEAPRIRLAAAYLAARSNGDRARAIDVLVGEVESSSGYWPRIAAQYLAKLSFKDTEEQVRVEKAVLDAVGTAQENLVLRALVSCAGPRTAERLQPILGDDLLPRAVHMALILSHHPTAQVRNKALRRLAIVGLFWRVHDTDGVTIRFPIAKKLKFVQHLDEKKADDEFSPLQSLKMPDRFLQAFAFTPAEQEFAIRVYRRSLVKDFAFQREIKKGMVHPLDIDEWWGNSQNADSSHLPLLRVMTEKDGNLQARETGGGKVAHLPYRQAAAELVAGITGEDVSYMGLSGDSIPSKRLRKQPYKDQNHLVAKWLLRRLQRLLEKVREQKEAGGNFPKYARAYRMTASTVTYCQYARAFGIHEDNKRLCERCYFGPALAEAMKAEAAEDDLHKRFEYLGQFYPWNTGFFGP